MFKLLLIISAFIALPYFSGAQNTFKAGVKAGVIGSQIDGDGYTGWDKAGFTGGGFVRTELNESWGVQFDLLYSQKGSRDPQDPDNGKYDYYLIKVDYIEIPLNIQYTLSKFRAEAGLSFGALINVVEENAQGAVPNSAFDFNPIEVGYQLGAYFDITERIFFNVRYLRSLLPMSNEFRYQSAQFGFFGGAYNSAFSFTLGYQFVN